MLSRLHSDGTVESDSFTVHHWVVDDCTDHLSKVGRIAKSENSIEIGKH